MASSHPSTPPSTTYYDKGSVELAMETPVMMKKLQKRADLTDFNSELLLVVLVGLPARGKSFISRKLLNYLTWRGNKCKIFNVGQYRRQAAAKLPHDQHDRHSDSNGKRQKAGACDADFFDDNNQAAAQLRQHSAHLALADALTWLTNPKLEEPMQKANGDNPRQESDDSNVSSNRSVSHSLGSLDESPGFADGHFSHSYRRQHQRIAIFDATNSTRERRNWILQQSAQHTLASGKRTGVVFVESICNDTDLLKENFLVKINSCPDFEGMSEEEALADLQARVAKYEARYEPVDDLTLSYIKIFNLSSRLEVNHIYGRLAKVVVPALMAWNVGSRPIYLCRAGETKPMQLYLDAQAKQQQHTLEVPRRLRGDRLGPGGLKFRDALGKFVLTENLEYMERKNKNVIHPSNLDTGTSITGLYPKNIYHNTDIGSDDEATFPSLVMSSTLPRALETATAWPYPFPVKDTSNLNPLDMGDFTGMDLATIRKKHREWYEELEREPFHTRFPGGESYSDLINRLESVVIDMEQQLGPVVVVSHVSVLQVLISYFRSTPVEECTSIEVPMHTVLKFVPLRGGGWLESHHPMTTNEAEAPNRTNRSITNEPIWGDSRSCLPQKLNTVADVPTQKETEIH